MPSDNDSTAIDSTGSIRRGALTYLPVVPGRLEFARHVRQQLLEHSPKIVAVELPTSLEAAYRRALKRMPKMSVILIPDDDDQEQANATFIPIEPGDPFTEALRTAQDIEADIVFLEPAMQDRPHVSDTYPEPFAVEIAGLGPYIDAYRVHPQTRTPAITGHASAMAWKLQGVDPQASVTVVVSLNMLDPLLDAMELPQESPAAPRATLFNKAELFNLHPDCLAEVTNEPPFYQEIYEQGRYEVPAPKVAPA